MAKATAAWVQVTEEESGGEACFAKSPEVISSYAASRFSSLPVVNCWLGWYIMCAGSQFWPGGEAEGEVGLVGRDRYLVDIWDSPSSFILASITMDSPVSKKTGLTDEDAKLKRG